MEKLTSAQRLQLSKSAVKQAVNHSMEYLEQLDPMSVAPSPESLATLSKFEEAMPETSGHPPEGGIGLGLCGCLLRKFVCHQSR